MTTRIALDSLGGGACLAGCATVPTGPNVMVMPGPQKTFDQFQADQASCQQYASASIGGSSAAANAQTSAADSAVVGTLLGAAAGAAIGAATGNAGAGRHGVPAPGLLFGSAAGANAAGYSYADSQRRYDIAYSQCMYARGNQLPGRVAYRAAPVAPLSAAQLSAAESFRRRQRAAHVRAADVGGTGIRHAAGRRCAGTGGAGAGQLSAVELSAPQHPRTARSFITSRGRHAGPFALEVFKLRCGLDTSPVLAARCPYPDMASSSGTRSS